MVWDLTGKLNSSDPEIGWLSRRVSEKRLFVHVVEKVWIPKEPLSLKLVHH